MSTSCENTSCETIEIHLSALLDGELEPPESLPVVDHLLECSACRSFYRRGRALDELVLESPREEHDTLPPGDVWRRIAAETGLERRGALLRFPERFVRTVTRSPAWARSLAALLVVAVGLALLGLWLRAPVPGPNGSMASGSENGSENGSGEMVLVELGEDEGDMTDDRFVELAAEILRADRRYHKKMLQVMSVVTEMGPVEEGTSDERQVRVRGQGARVSLGEDEGGDDRVGERGERGLRLAGDFL